MPKIELSTQINAPIERCFDLARSIDLHMESTKATGEQAIAGCTGGLIGLGETVTWRAKHLGIRQTLTSKITRFEYPNYFTDEMVTGAFKCFRHDHVFSYADGQTIMKDVFDFESPLGLLGKLANFLFLTDYMRRLLETRNLVIKKAAENR
ncbi:MAG TPA: SRPBCC family protein [Mucilaginibacter sp.]|jgi:ligand-binding SRPBCC domain-containing protein|nr:SRPBCC family protein [Mucilaginibacter sp.]